MIVRSALPAGLVLLPCLMGLACESGSTTSTAMVRDSAGIRIVENVAPLCRAEDGWTVAAEPFVDIGDLDDPAQQLFRVSGATRLSDGRIVVANAGSSQLRFYDDSGNHLMDVGRQGRGPGEFQYLAGAVRGVGDTLHVPAGIDRIITFASDGSLVRETPAGYLGLFEQPWMTEGGRLMPDRTWLLWVYENRRDQPDGSYRPILGFVRFDPATGAQDTLGWFRSGMHERAGGETKWVAFSPNSSATWSSSHIFAGDSKAFDIHAFDRDGTLSHIVRMATEPQPVTEEMKAEYRAAYIERVSADPRAAANMERYERMMAELPWAPTLPAWGQLAGDEAGHLWVSDYSANTPTADWKVFAPDGRWLTNVRLPDGVRVLELGDDYLIALWQDDLDVEHVRLHEIVKGSCR